MGDPFFNQDDYESYPLDKQNFNKITPHKSDRKISCIDGGNQELYPTPEYSVQLNRIYFNVFKNKKLIPLKSNIPRRNEFFSLTSSNRDGENVYFETKLTLEKNDFRKYLPSEVDLRIKAFESDFGLGNKALMERMASMARRFSEWTIAEHIIDSELDEGDIIIKDGSLQTSHINENKYVERVFKKAKQKDVIFTGLSKTCRLTTNTGYSLIASIEKFAEESNIQFDEWCYYPVARSKEGKAEHKALIMIVKLNRYADTSFRFEIFKDQADNMNKKEILDIISSIADYSRDITIPGYIYGLFDAHIWARVRKEEIMSYQAMLDSELARLNSFKSFKSRVNAVSIHDKLDEM